MKKKFRSAASIYERIATGIDYLRVLIHFNPGEALETCQEIEAILQTGAIPETSPLQPTLRDLKIQCRTWKAFCYLCLQDTDTACSLAREVISCVDGTAGLRREQALLHNILANYHIYLFETQQALECSHQVLQIAEEERDDWLLYEAYNTIAFIFSEVKNYNTAVDYLMRVRSLETMSPAQNAINLNNLACNLTELGRLDEAERYARESSALIIEYGMDCRRSMITDTLGDIALRKGRFEEAEQLFLEAQSMAGKNRYSHSCVRLNLARARFLAGSDLTEESLLSALHFAREKGVRSIEAESCRLLSQYHETAEQYKKALEYTKTYHQIRQSVVQSELESRFRTLDAVRKLEQTRKESECNRQLALEKETSLREAHHRIKNNLAMVSALVKIQADSSMESEAFNDLANKINAIATVHDQLYKTDIQDSINIRGYVQHLLENLFHNISGQSVSVENQIEPVLIDGGTATTLGMIINELGTNALKHAFGNGTGYFFRIALHRDGDIVLTQSNNGNVFDWAQGEVHKDSLGLQLIHSLVEQLKGRINLDTMDGITTITIRFPDPEKNTTKNRGVV